MMPRVAGPPFSDEQIETAVQALNEPGRLDEAQRIVSAQAPQLQVILNEAISEANWFGSAHDEQVLRAAGVADPDERVAAVKALMMEEARIAMLIGVAVGIQLKDELTRGDTPPDPPDRDMEA
jgi:hypothetical protein